MKILNYVGSIFFDDGPKVCERKLVKNTSCHTRRGDLFGRETGFYNTTCYHIDRFPEDYRMFRSQIRNFLRLEDLELEELMGVEVK